MSDMQDKHAIKEAIGKIKDQNTNLETRVNALEEQVEAAIKAVDEMTKAAKASATKPPPLKR